MSQPDTTVRAHEHEAWAARASERRRLQEAIQELGLTPRAGWPEVRQARRAIALEEENRRLQAEVARLKGELESKK